MSLIIRLNGESLAIPVRNVHEVINIDPAHPGAARFQPDGALADQRARHAVVPLVDIRRTAAACPPTRQHDEGRIVVLDLPRKATKPTAWRFWPMGSKR